MQQSSQAKTDHEAVFERALSAVARLHGSAMSVEHFIQPVAHPMHRGIDARSALVQIDGTNTRFFLKVLLAEQALFCDFGATVEASTRAAEAGLAPTLVSSDDKHSALLYQALDDDWRSAMGPDLRKTNIREAAIRIKKAWHAQPQLSATQTSFDRIYALQDHLIKVPIIMPLPEGYLMMCDWIARIENGLLAAGFDSAPCHVENSISNLMLGPDKRVQLVDFDRAANGDPLADIGALCNNYCRTDDDIAQAAEIYHGQIKRSVLNRIKLFMIVEDFYWGLWGKACHFLSTRRDIEFYKFGENHFLRCLHRLYAWDVDALLRSI